MSVNVNHLIKSVQKDDAVGRRALVFPNRKQEVRPFLVCWNWLRNIYSSIYSYIYLLQPHRGPDPRQPLEVTSGWVSLMTYSTDACIRQLLSSTAPEWRTSPASQQNTHTHRTTTSTLTSPVDVLKRLSNHLQAECTPIHGRQTNYDDWWLDLC